MKILCTESCSDYFDAINLGNIICEIDGFFAEGGAKNIARRDGMTDTDGDFFAVSNEETRDVCKMFEELEEIDIYSAAGVATASLIQDIENKQVKSDDIVMLNITGSGEKLFKSTHEITYLKPDYVFSVSATKGEIKDYVSKMM